MSSINAARLPALDVFRGATVALMILVNNPGSWKHLFPPLAHAPWHGMTPTDWVFPFFLFAVGLAMAMVSQRDGGLKLATVLRRSLLIFSLGLLLNASPFVRWSAAGELVMRNYDTFRVMGVLQRIALSYLGAALLLMVAQALWLPKQGRTAKLTTKVLVVVAALLLGYWAATVGLGRPGDPFSLEGFFGTALDRAWLGPQHLYQGEGVPFDPEGFAATVPCIAQVLLGWWAGQYLQGVRSSAAQAPSQHPEGLAAAHPAASAAAVFSRQLWLTLGLAAVALCAVAWLWSLWLPLNKKIWTSSYVLMTTGLALLGLVLLLHVPPVGASSASRISGASIAAPLFAPLRWLWRGCEAMGQNALAIFVLSGLVPRMAALFRWPTGVLSAEGKPMFTSPLPWFYETVFAPWPLDPRIGSMAYAVLHMAAYLAFALCLKRRGIFIRV